MVWGKGVMPLAVLPDPKPTEKREFLEDLPTPQKAVLASLEKRLIPEGHLREKSQANGAGEGSGAFGGPCGPRTHGEVGLLGSGGPACSPKRQFQPVWREG
jgi:hypothetical protein